MFHDPQFWILVAFIIFIIAIFKPVRSMLVSVLDSKINEIKNSIDEAEKIKTESQQTLTEIKKRQNDVKNEILIIQNEGKEKINLIEKYSNEKLKEQINKRNQLAKLKITQMTREANIQVQKHIVQYAINTTIKILEKKLDKTEKQILIDHSIKELNSILKS